MRNVIIPIIATAIGYAVAKQFGTGVGMCVCVVVVAVFARNGD